MIAVDTSALVALVLEEPQSLALQARISAEASLLLSAGTVAEALVVSRRRGVGPEMEKLLAGFNFQIIPVTLDFAGKVADAYDQWGKGVHPAGLNLLDCFAYALAKEHACPLLFVGDDFRKTDVAVALP